MIELIINIYSIFISKPNSMNSKFFFRSLCCVFMILIATTLAFGIPPGEFDPSGTWEYNAPDVMDGYTTGTMTITKTDEGYRVFIGFDEYNMLEAENVKLEKNSLSFNLYVEAELVTLSGEFSEEKLTGKVSYSAGIFDITATRKE